MASNYIDYRPGTLNVILAVPHGGREKPAEIPDRKPNATYSGMWYCVEPDWRTFEAAEQIRDHLHHLTGKFPYFVASRLDRAKLDPNREVQEATFGEPLAIANYEYYHRMIEVAKDEVLSSKSAAGVLILDIHGQSHSHNLTELGYGLSASQIDSGTYSLSRESTIKCSASRPNRPFTDQELLAGKQSLGHFLQAESIACIPSPANPAIRGRSYFNGGYTVRTHASQRADAIQVELSKEMRSNDTAKLTANMKKVARAISTFCTLHYSINP